MSFHKSNFVFYVKSCFVPPPQATVSPGRVRGRAGSTRPASPLPCRWPSRPATEPPTTATSSESPSCLVSRHPLVPMPTDCCFKMNASNTVIVALHVTSLLVCWVLPFSDLVPAERYYSQSLQAILKGAKGQNVNFLHCCIACVSLVNGRDL